MPNTIRPHLSTPVFSNQQKVKPPARKMHGNVGKIRGILEMPPAQAEEPAPFFKGFGARAVNTKSPRTHKTHTLRKKLVHTTVHFKPGVRADMESIANQKEHSFSQVVNDACEFYAEATLEAKYKTSLKTELRNIIREELAAFGHRMVYFLLRVTFAAEHARLLITNVLKILLQTRGKYDQNHFHALVNDSAKTAKRNILRNNPQMKAVLAQFWASFTAEGTTEEDKEVKH